MSTLNLQEPLIVTSEETESSILNEQDQKLNRTTKTCGLVIGIILGVFTQLALNCMVFYLFQTYGTDFLKNRKVYIISGFAWSTLVTLMIVSITFAINDLFREMFFMFHHRNNIQTWHRIHAIFLNRIAIGVLVGNELAWFGMDMIVFGGCTRSVFVHTLLSILLQLIWCTLVQLLFFKDTWNQDKQIQDKKGDDNNKYLDLI